MATTKASRPTRVKKKPLPKVSKPETLDNTDVAKRTIVEARANIGKDPDLVETVGLGNLKVTTARGVKNDGNT